MKSAIYTLLGILVLAGAAALVAGDSARAAGVVTDCANDTDFSAKLSGGGQVTFSCGNATIILGGEQTIASDTTIDGGGQITLSGGNATRLFLVNPGVTLTLQNIIVTNGYSSGHGGAIFNNGGTLVLEGATVRNSTAGRDGGGIVTTGTLQLTSSTLSNNTAANGGAILAAQANAQVSITNSTLIGNQVTGPSPDPLVSNDGWGGAIYAWGDADVQIDGGNLGDNTAGVGGAIYNQGAGSAVAITAATVSTNESKLGGGILNEDGTVTINRTTLAGNTAVGGGAIANDGRLGGGTVTVLNSTLKGNVAAYDPMYFNPRGGGIYNVGTSDSLVVQNSTISGNNSSGGGLGGGIYNEGQASLVNVSVVGNETDLDAGGLSSSSQLTVKNTIVAQNTSGNCSIAQGAVFSFNLSDDNSCGFGVGRDNVANVNLGNLADNGGPTETHTPLDGSQAIDNGTGIGCPATDQRGAPRPAGAACDVGAVEYGSSPPTPIPTPTPSLMPSTSPSPTATPTPTPTPTGTLTPTATATPTPTASPTGTSNGLTQGDVDCNGDVSSVDALKELRHVAELPVSQEEPCPDIGDDVGSVWGDVDCSDEVTSVDALKVLRFVAELPVSQTEPPPCPDIGSTP